VRGCASLMWGGFMLCYVTLPECVVRFVENYSKVWI
jgi:hypothetical protein